jgi:hypothetical protein
VLRKKLLDIIEAANLDLDASEMRLASAIRKAIRVARLRNDHEGVLWLVREMIESGDKQAQRSLREEIQSHYTKDEYHEITVRYFGDYFSSHSASHMTDDKGKTIGDDKVCAFSAPELESRIRSLEQAGRDAVTPEGMHPVDLYFTNKQNQSTRLACRVTADQLRVVRDRIAHRVAEYLSATERQVLLGQVYSDVFLRYRQYVDEQLETHAPSALEQLRSVEERLGEASDEALSHATLSCRRVMKTLADFLFPVGTTPHVTIESKHELTDDKYVNRLWQFVTDKVGGGGLTRLLGDRIRSLGTRLDHVYELDSKGVHARVKEDEAQQAFIETYLCVGDLMHIFNGNSALVEEKEQ